jgi:hypothetical protein
LLELKAGRVAVASTVLSTPKDNTILPLESSDKIIFLKLPLVMVRVYEVFKILPAAMVPPLVVGIVKLPPEKVGILS